MKRQELAAGSKRPDASERDSVGVAGIVVSRRQ